METFYQRRNNNKMNKLMGKIQRFGGAMYTPVLLLTFAGIVVGLTAVFQNQFIMGPIAAEGTTWSQFWLVIKNGTNGVMRQLPFLFLLGLPIGLAKKENARVSLEAFVLYMTFNYFLGTILEVWGSTFGVDFSAEVGGVSGLAMLGGIKTLDTGMIGALIVSGITVYLHNRYFDKSLPEWLGVFRGSSFICMIGFFAMLGLAFIFVFIWPQIQHLIASFQGFMESSGAFGVGIYGALERGLIPTGLHHFIYSPFLFDSAVVEGGIRAYWADNLLGFTTVTEPLRNVFPSGGFSLFGMTKVFAPIGIALAFYTTAKTENKKRTASILIPVVLTATVAGITEPLEFTFLFAAPLLFIVHALLAGLINGIAFAFGVVGEFSSGLLNWLPLNWIPLGANQWPMYVKQVIIGLIFSVLWFVIFRFLIVKFDLKTPGREDGEIILINKKEYNKRKNNKENNLSSNKAELTDEQEKALFFLEGLGGYSNIEEVANCATRLRITVKDSKKVSSESYFKSYGAHGLVSNGNVLQIIVGLSVPQVKSAFNNYVNEGITHVSDIISGADQIETCIKSPLVGKVIPLSEVPDEVFAQKMMGDGVAIVSSTGDLYAPVNGKISFIVESNHAFGIEVNNGLEILIHVGLETVGLKGKGFIPKVSIGEVVVAGQLICELDRSIIHMNQAEIFTPVIITNSDQLRSLIPHYGKVLTVEEEIMDYVI